ncbi:MAG: DUF4012 domain-containing protein [Candidatus Dojkabacteria bacterium]|nr:DUF4012 domain-containing protein [Candidatus Dojkabacteria bacterium]
MDTINGELENFSFLKTLSFTEGYYNNLEVANSIIIKSNLLIDDAMPQLIDLLAASGFRTDPSQPLIINSEPEFTTFTGGTDDSLLAENKEENSINLIMSDLDEYIDLYERLEPDILDIVKELELVDPTYVPNIRNIKAKGMLIDLQDIARDFPNTSRETAEFLREVPNLIGSKETVTYLLILQNEAEMRSSGGLITVYGTLSITDGEVDNVSLTDTWNLENFNRFSVGVDTGPDNFYELEEIPPYVSPYSGYYQNIYGQSYLMNSFNNSCGATILRAQDVGLYPDLNLTAQIFSRLL